MTGLHTHYTAKIDEMRAEDRQNPFLIAEAAENTLLRSARKTVFVMLPSLLIGLAGMGIAAAGGGPLVIWAAAAVMTLRTIKERQIEIPNLRDQFNTLAAGIEEPKPRAELKKVSNLLNQDFQSAASWAHELNPRRHPIRVPFVALTAAWGLMAAPTMIPLAAFVMAGSLLDSHSDHVGRIRNQTAQSRAALRPWRTGLRFG